METGVNRGWVIVLLVLIAASGSVAGPAKAGPYVIVSQYAGADGRVISLLLQQGV
jgi:hypothetical protein